MRLIDGDALKTALRELYKAAGWGEKERHFSLLDMECNIDFMPETQDDQMVAYNELQEAYNKLHDAMMQPRMVICPHCLQRFYLQQFRMEDGNEID